MSTPEDQSPKMSQPTLMMHDFTRRPPKKHPRAKTGRRKAAKGETPRRGPTGPPRNCGHVTECSVCLRQALNDLQQEYGVYPEDHGALIAVMDPLSDCGELYY